MMTNWRNSLTWKDTIEYVVDVYSFLIRGCGEMSGKRFADAIRSYCGQGDDRQKAILQDVEKHIVKINATYKGTGYYII